MDKKKKPESGKLDKATELIKRGKEYAEKKEKKLKESKDKEEKLSFKPTLKAKFESEAMNERSNY